MATASLSSISAKIDQGQGTIGALINDKKIYTQLDQTTAGLRDTVVKAQAGVSDFQENMEALKKNFLLRGYFKNRGYEDSSDLAKYEIAQSPAGRAPENIHVRIQSCSSTKWIRPNPRTRNLCAPRASFWPTTSLESRWSWFPPAWRGIRRKTWC